MPATINTKYKTAVRGIVHRNIRRNKPIKDIFGMLSRWRNVDRVLNLEENRDYALKCLAEDEKGGRAKQPIALDGGENVVILSFGR